MGLTKSFILFYFIDNSFHLKKGTNIHGQHLPSVCMCLIKWFLVTLAYSEKKTRFCSRSEILKSKKNKLFQYDFAPKMNFPHHGECESFAIILHNFVL